MLTSLLKNLLILQKTKVDILLNVGDKQIIIVECKTRKERCYNKFSAVSRQLKAYQKLAKKNELRVVKTLLVAPEFSDDFIADCEMNMNISLIKASSLMRIFEEFKSFKHTH